MKKITGVLVQIGTDENGFCRAIIKLDPNELKQVERLPMYERVELTQIFDPRKDPPSP